MRSTLFAIAIVAVVAVAGATSAGGVQSGRATGAAEVVETGAQTYASHCASCHGDRGEGDGPVSSSLRQRPANLTTIARRRNGRFPREEMMDFILGRTRRIGAHGTRDMPVWGPLFRELNPFDSNVDVRANRLLDYLESIQVK